MFTSRAITFTGCLPAMAAERGTRPQQRTKRQGASVQATAALLTMGSRALPRAMWRHALRFGCKAEMNARQYRPEGLDP